MCLFIKCSIHCDATDTSKTLNIITHLPRLPVNNTWSGWGGRGGSDDILFSGSVLSGGGSDEDKTCCMFVGTNTGGRTKVFM